MLDVRFNGKRIIHKQLVDLKDVQKEPYVNLKPPANKYYTTIMFDPDVPSKENPFNKNYLHWLKVNNNDTIVNFKASEPPPGTGSHRYCICVLEQQSELNIPPISQRTKFDVKGFINGHKLNPISYVMYSAKNTEN
jgi:phosphatidylethanolamine-binding protein (PEBP) family uncharacterized protein